MFATNVFLKRHFVPWHNRTLAVTPAQPGNAFVSLTDKAMLDRILCLEHTRIVANDNTVSYGKRVLQIPASPHRFSFARTSVTVREHLDGHLSLWHGPRPIGWYEATGELLPKAPKLGHGKGAAA